MKAINGFTLIEILIALAVFAILATITSSAMYYTFNTRNRVSVQAEALLNLQLAIALLEQDSSQARPRNIRIKNMQLSPSFIGHRNYVEFTRGGSVNPDNELKISSLQRVAWLCQNEHLVRRSWPQIDTVNTTLFNDKILLDHVKSCQFSYLNEHLQSLDQWQEPLDVNQSMALPKAIQLKLSLENWGEASFILVIPGAAYEKT